jgi:succinyl-CoA synthetase beta subunit
VGVCSNHSASDKIIGSLPGVGSRKRSSFFGVQQSPLLRLVVAADDRATNERRPTDGSGIIMKIHEYQAKGILKKYDVSVPRGVMATTREEAEAAARDILESGATGVVVKAQIHAGGRGKGGGVKLAKSVEEAGELAGKILGMKLVTHQTGPEGRVVHRLLIEETLPIEKELYLGILVDRGEGKPVFMASAAGGMDIEQVAAERPEEILKQYIDPGMGLEPFQARKIAFALGLKPAQINPAVKFLAGLYRAFLETDASLVEINPFISCTDGRLFALDAKLTFDDNALFRHADLRELRDLSEEDPLEVEASKYNLNYIKLDGSVGCMVNGAGLAMATMDIIKYAGGLPANFLDVGGGANSEQVAHAFEILLSDKSVRAVLINIFGGILRVDTLAAGVVDAAKKTNLQLPVVLRLEGTNVQEGKKILMESGLNFTIAETMKDAADKVVAAARSAA